MILVVHLGSTLLLYDQFGTGLVIAPSDVYIEPLLIKMYTNDLLVCRKTLKVCCEFCAKFLVLAPLILQEIWHGGVRIRFQVMLLQKRADCCSATPTIDLIGRMFIRHVCIFVEFGHDGILHDGE